MRYPLLILLLLIGFSAKSQNFGEPSFVKSIYFRGGSFYLSKEQNKGIKSFLDSIPNVHNYIITVHGHTDDRGGAEYNQWLSEMRNESVIEVLTKDKKIHKESIEIKDFGLFNPVYDNSTWYGRRMNRRVDVIFWLAI